MSVAEDEAQLKRASSQSSKLDGVEAAPVGGDEPVEKKSHKKRIEKQAFREIHVAEDQGDTLVLEEHIVEDEEEETISFANWNVPSWQELIASLYRPERSQH